MMGKKRTKDKEFINEQQINWI